MQFLNYSLASIISYSGLIVGMVLIFVGPEEKKLGVRYFIFMQNIIFLLILFFLFYYYRLSFYLIFLLMAVVAFLLFYHKGIEKIKQHIVYTLLGIMFYLSSKNINLFTIQASLIFIYGLPTGSLLTESKKKWQSFRKILTYSYFIIIALILEKLI